MDKWMLFHDFHRLVRRGLAHPILCPYDSTVLSVTIIDNDDPGLVCYTCDTITKPGLHVLEQMEAAVNAK